MVNLRLYRNYELVPAEEAQTRPKQEEQKEVDERQSEVPIINSIQGERAKRPRRETRLPSRFLE